MIARVFGVVVALSTILSQPAFAAQPIGGWKIEPSDVRCVAVRQYGAPDKPTTLAIKASPTEDALQLAILRPGFRKGYAETGANIQIDDEKYTTSALSYPLASDKHRVVHLINLDSVPSAALRSAKSLNVGIKEGIYDDFPLGQMSEIRAGLDKCVQQVRKTWNIGPEGGVNLSTGAEGSIQGIFSADDYPRTSQRNDEQGTASFILLIDEKGVPRDCTVAGSSGAALLDSRSCGIVMERARFKPAMDPSGKSIKSAWQQRITWRLEH